MKNTLIGIIKIALSIFLIKFGESYFFEVLSFIGINTSSLSYLVREILIVIFYILILLLVFFLYRDDLTSDLRRYKRNMFPNILMSIVFFVVLALVISITNYLGEIIAEAFKVNYKGLINLNIFNDNIDIYFIFNLLKNILIIPFVLCTTYVLGVNKLIVSKNKGIIFSGLLAAIIAGISMKGTFIYILINVIPYFITYLILAYIYRKNNANIWYSITTFILYSLLADILLAKILGG